LSLLKANEIPIAGPALKNDTEGTVSDLRIEGEPATGGQVPFDQVLRTALARSQGKALGLVD
jgi:hypothetical protein